jgi:hypothetical protein
MSKLNPKIQSTSIFFGGGDRNSIQPTKKNGSGFGIKI